MEVEETGYLALAIVLTMMGPRIGEVAPEKSGKRLPILSHWFGQNSKDTDLLSQADVEQEICKMGDTAWSLFAIFFAKGRDKKGRKSLPFASRTIKALNTQ